MYLVVYAAGIIKKTIIAMASMLLSIRTLPNSVCTEHTPNIGATDIIPVRTPYTAPTHQPVYNSKHEYTLCGAQQPDIPNHQLLLS